VSEFQGAVTATLRNTTQTKIREMVDAAVCSIVSDTADCVAGGRSTFSTAFTSLAQWAFSKGGPVSELKVSVRRNFTGALDDEAEGDGGVQSDYTIDAPWQTKAETDRAIRVALNYANNTLCPQNLSKSVVTGLQSIAELKSIITAAHVAATFNGINTTGWYDVDGPAGLVSDAQVANASDLADFVEQETGQVVVKLLFTALPAMNPAKKAAAIKAIQAGVGEVLCPELGLVKTCADSAAQMSLVQLQRTVVARGPLIVAVAGAHSGALDSGNAGSAAAKLAFSVKGVNATAACLNAQSAVEWLAAAAVATKLGAALGVPVTKPEVQAEVKALVAPEGTEAGNLPTPALGDSDVGLLVNGDLTMPKCATDADLMDAGGVFRKLLVKGLVRSLETYGSVTVEGRGFKSDDVRASSITSLWCDGCQEPASQSACVRDPAQQRKLATRRVRFWYVISLGVNEAGRDAVENAFVQRGTRLASGIEKFLNAHERLLFLMARSLVLREPNSTTQSEEEGSGRMAVNLLQVERADPMMMNLLQVERTQRAPGQGGTPLGLHNVHEVALDSTSFAENHHVCDIADGEVHICDVHTQQRIFMELGDEWM